MTETLISPTAIHDSRDSDTDVDREDLTATLFLRIHECQDSGEIQEMRERIVSINMRVADSLARRYFGHGENNDDLKQVAYLGLIKAVAGFDPTRKKNFLSYAVPTISGELKKHFRDRCWTVRPPRRIQDLQRDITSIRESMNQQNQQQPTIEEIAEELDVPTAQVVEAMAAQGCFTPTSLDSRLKSDSTTTFAELLPGDNRDIERSEARMLLAPILEELPEADRRTLVLRFFEEWTQEQIAQQLGTSQMQISRQLSRLMRQLRSRLETHSRVA